MFSRFESPSDAEFTSEFDKYWPIYRGEGGVLDEISLKEYTARYREKPRELLNVVWDENGGPGGRQMAEAVRDWFQNNALKADAYFRYRYVILFRALKDHAHGVSPRVASPIQHEAEWESVREFCDRFDRACSSLHDSFSKLKDEAIAKGPTPWEAALQSFPIDSKVGTSFPWLRSIEKYLALMAFRAEWHRLAEIMGS
jgi:hypothetical protein